METNFQRGPNISYPRHVILMLDILASLALKKPIFGALVFWKDMFAKAFKIGFHLAQTPLWILAYLVAKKFRQA